VAEEVLEQGLAHGIEEDQENKMVCKEKFKKIHLGFVSSKHSVKVELPGGDTLTLAVDTEQASVSEVVELLRNQLQLGKLEPIYLTYADKLLSLFSTLRSYSIKNGATLKLDCFRQLKPPNKPHCHICPMQPFG
jgi:hypothetical protein